MLNVSMQLWKGTNKRDSGLAINPFAKLNSNLDTFEVNSTDDSFVEKKAVQSVGASQTN